MLQTSNPALRTGTFAELREGVGQIAQERAESKTMTVEGTALKMGALLILVAAGAAWSWSIFFNAGEAGYQAVMPWMIGGVIAGLITAIVTIFKQNWAPYTAPFYAVFEGLFLGAISAFFDARYPGLPMMAVGLTFGVTFLMGALYVTGVIKVTGRLIGGIIAATGAVALLYLTSLLFSMFGMPLSFMHGSGLLSIGISVVVVVIAALNLVLDFHVIEENVEAESPKWMEWYGAFSLLVTLVWLYIELLHLLAKIQGRR